MPTERAVADKVLLWGFLFAISISSRCPILTLTAVVERVVCLTAFQLLFVESLALHGGTYVTLDVSQLNFERALLFFNY